MRGCFGARSVFLDDLIVDALNMLWTAPQACRDCISACSSVSRSQTCRESDTEVSFLDTLAVNDEAHDDEKMNFLDRCHGLNLD